MCTTKIYIITYIYIYINQNDRSSTHWSCRLGSPIRSLNCSSAIETFFGEQSLARTIQLNSNSWNLLSTCFPSLLPLTLTGLTALYPLQLPQLRQFWSKLARYAGAPLPWYHVPRAESQNRGDGTIHRSRRNEPWQEYAFNLEMFECYTSVSLGWHVLDLLDAFSPQKKDRQVTGHGIFWGLFRHLRNRKLPCQQCQHVAGTCRLPPWKSDPHRLGAKPVWGTMKFAGCQDHSWRQQVNFADFGDGGMIFYIYKRRKTCESK